MGSQTSTPIYQPRPQQGTFGAPSQISSYGPFGAQQQVRRPTLPGGVQNAAPALSLQPTIDLAMLQEQIKPFMSMESGVRGRQLGGSQTSPMSMEQFGQTARLAPGVSLEEAYSNFSSGPLGGGGPTPRPVPTRGPVNISPIFTGMGPTPKPVFQTPSGNVEDFKTGLPPSTQGIQGGILGTSVAGGMPTTSPTQTNGLDSALNKAINNRLKEFFSGIVSSIK